MNLINNIRLYSPLLKLKVAQRVMEMGRMGGRTDEIRARPKVINIARVRLKCFHRPEDSVWFGPPIRCEDLVAVDGDVAVAVCLKKFEGGLRPAVGILLLI